MKDYAFSKYIVALRHTKGLSRFDLARKTSISYVTVAKWENAEAVPNREELEKLSAFFNLSCAAIRAHSFEEIAGAVTPVSVPAKPEDREIAPATVAETTIAQPAPKSVIEPAPSPKIEPAPVAEAPAPKAEPSPEIDPAPAAEPAPEVAESVAINVAEPIASTTQDVPPIDFSVVKNPEYDAFYEKKRKEEKNEEIVSSYTRFGVRVRRLFSATLDVLFSALFAYLVVISAFIVTASLHLSEDLITIVAVGSAIVAYYFAFALRDALMGGTSLGKRLLGLYVVDKVNATKPVVWQRVVRSLGQVFLPFPDAIVVLATGRGIGDLVAGTAVVSRRDYKKKLAEKNPLDPPVKVRKNRTFATAFVIVIALALVTAFIAGVGYFATVMLENEKTTEEYLCAYNELIESDEFAATGADVSELTFTFFSRSTELGENGSVTIVEYSFETNDYYIYVTVESSFDGITVTKIYTEQIFE